MTIYLHKFQITIMFCHWSHNSPGIDIFYWHVMWPMGKLLPENWSKPSLEHLHCLPHSLKFLSIIPPEGEGGDLEGGDLVLSSVYTSICTYIWTLQHYLHFLFMYGLCIHGLQRVIFQHDSNSKMAARWPLTTRCEILLPHSISISVWPFNSKPPGIIQL